MSLTEADLELIERKMAGALSDDDDAQFRSRLEDEVFAAEWKLQKGTADALETVFLRRELKKHLVETRSPSRGISFIHNKSYFLYPAAAAVLIIVALFIGFLFDNVATPEELFVSYYKPFSATQSFRGAGDEGQAMNLYAHGQYEIALAEFEAISEQSSPGHDDAMIRFMISQCYIGLERYSKAEEVLRPLASSDDLLIREHAKWYLALCYLRQENVKQCRELLQLMLKENSIYASQAEKLLDDLD